MEQYSDKWWAARLGKPSASCASRLVTSTGEISSQTEDYAVELANDLYAGKVVDAWSGNKYTKNGTETEQEARADYSMEYQATIEEVGMFTDTLMRWVASPDGCIGKDGLLEIKCLSAKVHTKTLFRYNQTGMAPPDYISQIQMQLLLSGRKWADLFLYHPDLPSLRLRQYPDKVFFKTLRKQLKAIEVQRNIYLEFLLGKNQNRREQ